VTAAQFPATSRYSGTEVAFLTDASGREIAYLRRRILPDPDRLALLTEHVVTEGERLDRIAYAYLGDPEQFWRICDGNRVLRPDELTETINHRIRITLAAGIPGAPRA
jgi:hypothetical protein